jgi:hypothetical protein
MRRIKSFGFIILGEARSGKAFVIDLGRKGVKTALF